MPQPDEIPIVYDDAGLPTELTMENTQNKSFYD